MLHTPILSAYEIYCLKNLHQTEGGFSRTLRVSQSYTEIGCLYISD